MPLVNSVTQNYERILLMQLLFTGYRLKVDLINNGPAVLDANVTFTVKLSNPSGVIPSGPFYCIFYDELGQSFTVSQFVRTVKVYQCANHCSKMQTEILNAVTFNFTTSYPSSINKKGYYRMDVTVYKTEFIFPMPQGSATTRFELTGIGMIPYKVEFP